ncbi:MAG: hypothetical protein H6563_11690 [Lewinellaceae bacterium]|nr:hypothetical protein [Lewinellaceae bacterium]
MKSNLTLKWSLAFSFVLVFFSGDLTAQKHAQTVAYAPPATNMSVNTFSGELYYQRQDLFIPDIGFDLDLTFHYHSHNGWTHSFDISYSLDSYGHYECVQSGEGYTTVTLQAVPVININWGNGSLEKFTRNHTTSGGCVDLEEGYSSPPGSFKLFEEYEPQKYRLITKDRTKYFFDNPIHKKITRKEDRNGNTMTYTYDGEGRLIQVTAPSGRSYTFNWVNGHMVEAIDANDTPVRSYQYQYSNKGSLIKVINPLQGEVNYAYDETTGKYLISVIDENGGETAVDYFNDEGRGVKWIATCLSKMEFTYDIDGGTNSGKTYVRELNGSSGNVTTTYEYSAGKLTARNGNCCGYDEKFVYDSDNNLVEYKDGNGNTTQYTYDSVGNFLQISYPTGCFTTLTYESEFNQLVSIEDGKGNLKSFDYDNNGNLISINYPIGVSESYTYNNQGLLVQHTDRNGNVTIFDFNSNGKIKKLVSPENSSFQFEYNNRGNLLSFQDAIGNITTYEYDLLGRLKKFNNPMSEVFVLEYDLGGNLVKITNPSGEITEYQYDLLDRLIIEDGPENLKYEYSYDGLGNVVELRDPRGGVLIFKYNGMNLVEKVIDQIGNEYTIFYDGAGNKTSVVNPNGNTVSYSYNKAKKVVKTTDALGFQTEYGYDCIGNLVTERDANGNEKNYKYDAQNRIVEFVDPSGHSTYFQYDGNDNVTSISDAKANQTNFSFDGLNRITQILFANFTTQNFSYDGNGNVINFIDNNGNSISYQYDALDRLVLRDYPGENDDVYQYDDSGNLIFAQNGFSSVVFSYDKAGRRISETLNGETIKYYYHPKAGKITKIYPSGTLIEEFYSKRGELIEIRKDLKFHAGFQYDAVGNLVQHNLSNNTSAQFYYNKNNWLTSIIHNPSQFIELNFAYDNVGNIVSQEFGHSPGNSEQYQYDNHNRLINFKKGEMIGGEIGFPDIEVAYEYDEVGNRKLVNDNGVVSIYNVNEMNEYVSVLSDEGAVYFNYDANGNLINDGNASYSYDYSNRIIASGGMSYAYDPLGRRILKWNQDCDYRYYYSGFEKTELKGCDFQLGFISGNQFDKFVSFFNLEEDFFYHVNLNNSIYKITNSEGELVEEYSYSPFGVVSFFDENGMHMTGSKIFNPLSFMSKERDSESQKFNYLLRLYDPEVGCFIQNDKLYYVDGLNMRSFVRNNPIKNIDLLGADSMDPNCALPCFLEPMHTQPLCALKCSIAQDVNDVVSDPINFTAGDLCKTGLKKLTKVSGPAGIIGGELFDKLFDPIFPSLNEDGEIDLDDILNNPSQFPSFFPYTDPDTGWIMDENGDWHSPDGSRVPTFDEVEDAMGPLNPFRLKNTNR